MSTTTAEEVIEGLEAHIATLVPEDAQGTDDRYIAVWGDNWEALESVERAKAFMVMPERGPVRSERSRCMDHLEVQLGIRWPITREGRGAMLREIERLREHVPTAPTTVTALHRAHVSGPTRYQYRAFRGENAVLSLTPVALEYKVDIA